MPQPSFIEQSHLAYRLQRTDDKRAIEWTLKVGETIIACGCAPDEREATELLAACASAWIRSQLYVVT